MGAGRFGDGRRLQGGRLAPTALRRILASCTQPFRAGLGVCRAYGAGVLRAKHVRGGIQSFDDKKIRAVQCKGIRARTPTRGGESAAGATQVSPGRKPWVRDWQRYEAS